MRDTAGQAIDAAIEAEIVLLGGLLVTADQFDEAQDALAPADFFRRSHQLIFEAMLQLASEGRTIDPFTVQHTLSPRDLEVVGKPYLFELMSGMPRGVNVGQYAAIVRDYAIRRELEAHGRDVIAAAQLGELSSEAMLLTAEQTIDRLRGRAVRVEVQSPAMRANMAYKQLEAIQDGRGIQGLTTGLSALDSDLRGLHAGNLVLIGARPSQGKSALALTMAIAASHASQLPALFFSSEMSGEELNLRELTMRSQVDGWRFTHGKLRESELPRVMTALEDLRSSHVHVVDNSLLTVSKIRVLCRRARATIGLSLVVIDYIGLLDDERDRGESRALAVGEISRGLKVLARELNVPIVALSQLNRNLEDRPDKMPRLSDLRESGSLEQDADVVLLLYRPPVYFPDKYENGKANPHAEIIIAKQRNGPIGTVEVEFIAEHTRFRDKVVA